LAHSGNAAAITNFRIHPNITTSITSNGTLEVIEINEKKNIKEK
jgi:hypothetical protein